jgi:hypothetical protein
LAGSYRILLLPVRESLRCKADYCIAPRKAKDVPIQDPKSSFC